MPTDHSLGASLTLRGLKVTVTDVGIHPADRSVGIMGPFLESFVLQDEGGNELNWYDDLTDEENDAISAAIFVKIDAEEERIAAELDKASPPVDDEAGLPIG